MTIQPRRAVINVRSLPREYQGLDGFVAFLAHHLDDMSKLGKGYSIIYDAIEGNELYIRIT